MAQRFTVTHDSSLLNYLFEIFPDQSRTSVKSYLKDSRILVGGQCRTAFDWPLAKGDTIELMSKGASIGREMKEDASELLLKRGVRILFEDEHIIVVDKNAGVPTAAQRTSTGRRIESVQSLLGDYLRTEKHADIKAGTGSHRAPTRAFIVQRIDRDASGLLIVAKDEYTRNLLLSKWGELVIEYTQTGIVEGHPARKSGRIESWLAENEKAQKMYSLPEEQDGAVRAVTDFKVTEEWHKVSVVEFKAITSRKNQIRVQAAYEIGHPIVGDVKYGSDRNFGGRIALHAGKLVFRNPYGSRTLRFSSPLPDTFARLR